MSDEARAWVENHTGPCSVVRIDTIANIAVAIAPWGPFAELLAHPDSSAAQQFSANPVVVFTEGDDPGLPDL